MKLQDKYLSKTDIALANFAKAIALPIRVCIIRMIIENGNEASREKLHEIPFNQTTINQHLVELKYLKIIKSVKKDRSSVFSVNENFFISNAYHFLTLFEPISQINEAANAVISQSKFIKRRSEKPLKPDLPSFGKFIQVKRKALKLSQEQFALLIKIDRGLLSRIECDKKSIKAAALKNMAKHLQVSIPDIYEVYYNDKMLKLAEENKLLNE